ncbi:zinc finger BED domain-containing protein RICESLEEPER 2-like [Senna tora]|uniref:Zinc finger BED domain-containing protein RICESLEEPER 2-like n=1 Tax=Senna tora TaxID=362788 RepID=A0A834TMM7_9FABA|nr:zinc finger BED domain-containing protein RICESLEEPER 2-like [Senna tora]
MKLQFIEYFFDKIYDNVDVHLDKIVATLQALFDHYKETPIETSSCSGDSTSNASTITYGGGCEDYDQFLSKKRMTQITKTELDLYLDEPNEKLEANIDILDFWRISASRFPKLSSMARDILAIPISNVASESTFSIGKKVINPWRSSMSNSGILGESIIYDVPSSDEDGFSTTNVVVEDVF